MKRIALTAGLDDERSRLRNVTDLVTKQQPKTCAGSLVNGPGKGSTSQIGPRDDGRRSRAGARNNALDRHRESVGSDDEREGKTNQEERS